MNPAPSAITATFDGSPSPSQTIPSVSIGECQTDQGTQQPAAPKGVVRVLVCDDSAFMRTALTRMIESDPLLKVVGAAHNGLEALQMAAGLDPDVITLDVEMPRMDGLDFLEKLMRLRPMPVVMVSSLTERGSEITLRALELGAVDFVTKPKLSIQTGMLEYAELITDKIRAAAKARVRARTIAPPDAAKGSSSNGARSSAPSMRAKWCRH